MPSVVALGEPESSPEPGIKITTSPRHRTRALSCTASIRSRERGRSVHHTQARQRPPHVRPALKGSGRARLRELIAELSGLNPDALVERYGPEAKPVEMVPFRETLARGEYGPRQVVVHRDAPPERRTGGNPAPFQPTKAAPGRVYTYDKDGNLVAV